MGFGCDYDVDPEAICFLGAVFPLPVVAIPAAVGGVGARRAFGASGGGWLGGVAAFLLTAHATDNFVVTALVSGLVHAGITTAILRS